MTSILCFAEVNFIEVPPKIVHKFLMIYVFLSQTHKIIINSLTLFDKV